MNSVPIAPISPVTVSPAASQASMSEVAQDSNRAERSQLSTGRSSFERAMSAAGSRTTTSRPSRKSTPSKPDATGNNLPPSGNVPPPPAGTGAATQSAGPPADSIAPVAGDSGQAAVAVGLIANADDSADGDAATAAPVPAPASAFQSLMGLPTDAGSAPVGAAPKTLDVLGQSGLSARAGVRHAGIANTALDAKFSPAAAGASSGGDNNAAASVASPANVADNAGATTNLADAAVLAGLSRTNAGATAEASPARGTSDAGSSDDGADSAATAVPGLTLNAGSASVHQGEVTAATVATNAAALLALAGDKHEHSSGDTPATAVTADFSQLTSSLGNTGATTAPATLAAPTLQVHASIDSPDFSQGLSDRVSWMVDNGVNSAKLQVNPPQLGPIELNIVVQGDHAQVSMTTHSAVARDALESSSPQLREMLGAQGFGQVSVDISQRSFQDRSAYTPHYERNLPSDRSAPDAAATVSAVGAVAPRSSPGALDAYA